MIHGALSLEMSKDTTREKAVIQEHRIAVDEVKRLKPASFVAISRRSERPA